MARISANLEDTLTRLIFNPAKKYPPLGNLGISGDINPLENNAFKQALVIDTSDCNNIVVPACARKLIEINHSVHPNIEYIMPLIFKGPNVGGAMFSGPAIFSCLSYYYSTGRLIRTVFIPPGKKYINDRYTYLFGNGMVFDKDFNLLFLFALSGKYQVTGFKYNAVKVYINPIVVGSKNYVEKKLYEAIFALYSKAGLCVPVSSYEDITGIGNSSHRLLPVDVLVTQSIENFVTEPEISPSEPFNNRAINSYLSDNFDDIVIL